MISQLNRAQRQALWQAITARRRVYVCFAASFAGMLALVGMQAAQTRLDSVFPAGALLITLMTLYLIALSARALKSFVSLRKAALRHGINPDTISFKFACAEGLAPPES